MRLTRNTMIAGAILLAGPGLVTGSAWAGGGDKSSDKSSGSTSGSPSDESQPGGPGTQQAPSGGQDSPGSTGDSSYQKQKGDSTHGAKDSNKSKDQASQGNIDAPMVPGIDQFQTEADRKTVLKIRQALDRENANLTCAPYVQVSAVRGTVTLHGLAQDAKQRKQFEKQAQDVAGKRNVKSLLRTMPAGSASAKAARSQASKPGGAGEPGAPGSKSDQAKPDQAKSDQASDSAAEAGDYFASSEDRALGTRIREVITVRPITICGPQLHIVAQKGKVTMHGTVDSATEKTKIEKAATKIVGKKNFTSELEVGESQGSQPGGASESPAPGSSGPSDSESEPGSESQPSSPDQEQPRQSPEQDETPSPSTP